MYDDIVSAIREKYEDATNIRPVTSSRFGRKKVVGWTFEIIQQEEYSAFPEYLYGWALCNKTVSADLNQSKTNVIRLVRLLARVEQ